MLHRLTSGSIPNALPLTVPANVRAILEDAMRFDRNQRTATCAIPAGSRFEAALHENGTPTTAADVASYSATFLEASASQRQEMVRSALEQASGAHAVAAADRREPHAAAAELAPGGHVRAVDLRPVADGRRRRAGHRHRRDRVAGPRSSPRGAVAAGILALTLVDAAALARGARRCRVGSGAGAGGSAALSAPAPAPAPLATEPPASMAATPATGAAVVPAAPLAPGAAALVPTPAATPARTHATRNAPAAVAAPAEAPASAPVIAATPAPVPVVSLSLPAPSPPPAPAPQVVFAPETGRVAVGKVDVDRVSARSINGLLRHVSFDRCYVAGLRARGSAVAGTAVLVLDIDQNEVARAHLEGDLGLPGMRGCIESQLAMQHVDDADTGSASAHVTLNFAVP